MSVKSKWFLKCRSKVFRDYKFSLLLVVICVFSLFHRAPAIVNDRIISIYLHEQGLSDGTFTWAKSQLIPRTSQIILHGVRFRVPYARQIYPVQASQLTLVLPADALLFNRFIKFWGFATDQVGFVFSSVMPNPKSRISELISMGSVVVNAEISQVDGGIKVNFTSSLSDALVVPSFKLQPHWLVHQMKIGAGQMHGSFIYDLKTAQLKRTQVMLNLQQIALSYLANLGTDKPALQLKVDLAGAEFDLSQAESWRIEEANLHQLNIQLTEQLAQHVTVDYTVDEVMLLGAVPYRSEDLGYDSSHVLPLGLMADELSLNGMRVYTADTQTLNARLWPWLAHEPWLQKKLLSYAPLAAKKILFSNNIEFVHRLSPSRDFRFDVVVAEHQTVAKAPFKLRFPQQPMLSWQQLDPSRLNSEAAHVQLQSEVFLSGALEFETLAAPCFFSGKFKVSGLSPLGALQLNEATLGLSSSHRWAGLEPIIGVDDQTVSPVILNLDPSACDQGQLNQVFAAVPVRLYPLAVEALSNQSLSAEKNLSLVKRFPDRAQLAELELSRVSFQPLSSKFSDPVQPLSADSVTKIISLLESNAARQVRIKPTASQTDLDAWQVLHPEPLDQAQSIEALRTLAVQRGQRLLEHFKGLGIDPLQLYLGQPSISKHPSADPSAYIYY